MYFDKTDGNALRKLIGLAKPLETHIDIVHIDDTKENPFINFDLNHFKEKYIGDEAELTVDFDLILNKNLSQAIEKYVADHSIDIVSVTARKRNIFTGLFHPSLTKELLFHLDIPMLIFHS